MKCLPKFDKFYLPRFVIGDVKNPQDSICMEIKALLIALDGMLSAKGYRWINEREIHALTTAKSITYALFHIEIYHHDERKKKRTISGRPGALDSSPLKARQTRTRKRGCDPKKGGWSDSKGAATRVGF